MAKVLKRTGVLAGDVGTLQQWANEVGLLFRGPEIHPNRPHVNFPHIHIGPVDHIPII